MNDDELITAVRESVSGVHTTTSAEQIVSRGRVMRTADGFPAWPGRWP